MNEDIGQIRYIFSDKTGTLTRNEMKFQSCSVMGNIYNCASLNMTSPKPEKPEYKTKSATASLLIPMGSISKRPKFPSTLADSSVVHSSSRQVDELGHDDLITSLRGDSVELKEFFNCINICHTVSCVREKGKIVMRAASPDEEALLVASTALGVSFEPTDGSTNLQVKKGRIVETYQSLVQNEFNSVRKCMSIIVRRSNGSLVMYIKGADNVMIHHGLAKSHPDTYASIKRHVNYFALKGLRTLVFGKRELTEEEYKGWKCTYDKAVASVNGRELEMEKAAKEIETDFELLGATGVEDRLQDGVPECIQTLRQAGISIWMLTGDKDETAVSVAYACGLVSNSSRIVVVNGKKKQDCLDQISNYRQKLKREGVWAPGEMMPQLALVINGGALEALMEKCVEKNSDGVARLLEIIFQCNSIVACRLNPLQKAQLVALIKNSKTKPLTMAIGDGGNDVSMIQEAHLGVGIYGHEGLQAIRAADFGLAQFQFLSRLILVHGRWNYRRVSMVILFSFYKNMALILTLFQYNFYNGYSGQTLYESYLMVGWNVFYTLMPIFVLGVIDEDITSNTVLQFPAVFKVNHTGIEFNTMKMVKWSLTAIFHSMVVYHLSNYVLSRVMISQPDGKSDGLYLFGTIVYGILVITVNAKSALSMQHWYRWTKWHYISVLGSILLYFIFIICYSVAYSLFPSMHLTRDFSGLAARMFKELIVWLTIPLVVVACLLADTACIYATKMYLPSSVDILQEIDSVGSNQKLDSISASLGQFRRGSWNGIRLGLNGGDDGTEPTEHEQLCGQLMTLQREVAREQGRIDPYLRREERESALNVAANPATDPLTLEFIGKSNAKLEAEYNTGFVLRESRRVQICMKIICIIIPPYALFELVIEKLSQNIPIRIMMQVCALLYLRYTYTETFIQYYQASVLIPIGMAGILFTLTITETGKFAITALPIVVFAVLRLKFINAVILATINYVFYLLAGSLNLQRDGVPPTPVTEGLMFTAFMTFIISFAAYSSYSVQMAMRRDFLQHRSLICEQARSLEILDNMFPTHVTTRLQNGETLIYDNEPNVTVLFCDICDFNVVLERNSAYELVTLLDRIYSLFDEMCHKHNVQKMETVGKTYMACAGLQGNNMDPAQCAADMALDMLCTVGEIETESGYKLTLRIGLHSGRVISGLVGMKKQQFSLFGDTVNTASRMQSTGIIGRCQMSEETHKQLNGRYYTTSRQVKPKGKGEMTTYILGLKKGEVCGMIAIDRGDKEVYASRASIVSPRIRSEFKIQMKRILEVWKRFDPFRILFGSVKGRSHKEEMQNEINRYWLNFNDARLEKYYIKRTTISRIEASIRTGVVMALYMVYSSIHEIVFYFTNWSNTLIVKKAKESSDYFVIPNVLRAIYLLMTVGHIYWLHNHKSTISYTIHRNTQCLLFYLTALLITMVQVWLSKYRYGTVETLSGNCLDIVFLLFLASNGGSTIHRISIFLSITIFLFPCIAGVYLHANRKDDDLAKFQMYPLVVTFFTMIANMIASRGVEFFTRRKVWLQKQAISETRKASNLLYKMLPESVILQLKGGHSVVDEHQNVGLLFSDIKGFTSIASRANTDQVVELLGRLFTAFDKLTEKHGVFKMQTIGDAYVIASGLPFEDSITVPVRSSYCSQDSYSFDDSEQISFSTTKKVTIPADHLPRLIAMAQDMHNEVRKILDPVTGERLEMRIGIHLGQIIGGVIGTTTLRYDMWGPDVLTANEMESNGVPKHTLISEVVKDVIKANTSIHFEKYKRITFSCGELDTYLIKNNPEEYL